MVRIPPPLPPSTDTNTPSSSTPSTGDEGATTEEPVEESPYNFAKGNYKVDENGFALEKYEYTKPLTEWDSYVAGVQAIGLTEMTAIYQEALDDFLAA